MEPKKEEVEHGDNVQEDLAAEGPDVDEEELLDFAQDIDYDDELALEPLVTLGDAVKREPFATETYFECPICSKVLKFRTSLNRHIKTFHGAEEAEKAGIKSEPKGKKSSKSKFFFLDHSISFRLFKPWP